MNLVLAFVFSLSPSTKSSLTYVLPLRLREAQHAVQSFAGESPSLKIARLS